MLLSRAAEAVYWTGRYLERAESTARIIKVHTELYLDLPRSAGLGWDPLLAITGSAEEHEALYPRADKVSSEEDIVSFLTADSRNPSSIVASLAAARENMRTTRPIFPRELWEALNNLFLLTSENSEEAVPRRTRLRWLDGVLADCQRLTGVMAGTMSHDDAYSFLRIGRHIERADMTTRVLDVRAGEMAAGGEDLRPFTDLTWMSVLKSLSAYQMYRRKVQSRVTGPDALRFLLQDPQFPRSVEYCLVGISRLLLELPRHEAAMATCAAAETLVADAKVKALAWDGLHEYVDDLQLELDTLHGHLAETYFTVDAPAQVMLATA
jgi:uncharacterized alpha-E superfamily protein